MTQNTRVKICGLTEARHVDAAARAGAAYVGFVFFEKSPRNISPQAAAALAIGAPLGLAKVALTVNASDEHLDRITGHVPLDMLQLHGDETPERVAEVRARYGLPVMKVIGVSGPDDIAAIDVFSRVADQIMVDAKAPIGAVRPGGNGAAFDWQLVAGRRWSVPWMLAGGLTSDNVAEAIRLTGVSQVDVSSGVETAPGRKDTDLITRFIEEATK